MMEHQDNDVRIAILGTGIMGSGMARRLARAGLRTTAWDRSPSAAAELADAGVQQAASPEDAVRDSLVVITMLPTADVVRSVMLTDGVVKAFAKGAVWAQMGTIGVAATKEVAARLAALRPDVLFVDAPVSGSKGPAARGQLLVLASGPSKAEAILRPAFSAIGRRTVWLGEAVQGSPMKLVVNAYMAVLLEGVAEALELADRFGIEHSKLAEAIEGGPLDAPIVDAKLQKMDRSDFGAEFPMGWALKDVDLALAEAGDEPPPLLSTLSHQWHGAVDAGMGREDISVARLLLGRRH